MEQFNFDEAFNKILEQTNKEAEEFLKQVKDEIDNDQISATEAYNKFLNKRMNLSLKAVKIIFEEP